MKFYIVVIFKKPFWSFSLFYCLIISLRIYLETGYLIENFVNDWYFDHKYAVSVKT